MDKTALPFKPAHVISDKQVSAGQGTLHTVTINGAPGTDGVVTIYDSLTAAGTIIAILTISVAASISVQPISLLYDVEYENGLFFDYDANLVADLTVSFI